MKRFIAVSLLTLSCALGQAFDGPPQAKRGLTLFRTSAKGACATCHSVAGFGTAVGPDLAKTAAQLPPRAMVMAIKATMTAYVVQVTPNGGQPFPAMKATADGEFYDLSKNPPELKKFKAGEFKTEGNSTWKHPPASADYTAAQLADVIAYLRYVAVKDIKGVDPDDIE